MKQQNEIVEIAKAKMGLDMMTPVFNERTITGRPRPTDSRRLRDCFRKLGYEARTAWLHEEINMKARIEAEILENARDGEVPVLMWGRDCDMCESTSARLIPANVRAFLDMRRDMIENAEGPCSLEVISWRDYEKFEPSFRDRALEAFEDGHPGVIYP